MKIKTFIVLLILLTVSSMTIITVSSASVEQINQYTSVNTEYNNSSLPYKESNFDTFGSADSKETEIKVLSLDKTGQRIFDELLKRAEEAKSKGGSAFEDAKTGLVTGMTQLGFSDREIETTLANIGKRGGNSSSNLETMVSLKKGIIYNGKNPIGVWDGNSAYVLNSAGKLVKNTDYTNNLKNAIKSGKIPLSNLATNVTSKIVKFTNNIQSGKVLNSGAYSLSRILTKDKKGTLIFRALSVDIANGKFNSKRFSKDNIYISTNALKKVLNDYSSTKYIARKSVSVSELKSASKKGKTILRVKSKDKKWHFITISKVSNGKVTVYDNKKSKKISDSSLKSYLKKYYKFTSGTAITYSVKIGKTPNIKHLNDAIGI